MVAGEFCRAASAAAPLPLARKVNALEERGGWGKLSPLAPALAHPVAERAPTPAIPRKRERGRTVRTEK